VGLVGYLKRELLAAVTGPGKCPVREFVSDHLSYWYWYTTQICNFRGKT